MKKYFFGIFLSGALAVVFSLNQWHPGLYLFKPLTTLLIVFLAFEAGGGRQSAYARKIQSGLVASIGGDVALMFVSENFFLLGMLCFLVAHLFYISALWEKSEKKLQAKQIVPLLVFIGYGVFIFSRISKNLGPFLIPVLIYLLVILIMGWSASITQISKNWSRFQKNAAQCAALLFIASDSLIALGKFSHPVPPSHSYEMMWILLLYYLSQSLFAVSSQKKFPNLK